MGKGVFRLIRKVGGIGCNNCVERLKTGGGCENHPGEARGGCVGEEKRVYSVKDGALFGREAEIEY